MDMVIRTDLPRAPQRCSLCQQPQDGEIEFVDVRVRGLEIKTAEGLKKIDGNVYVCVGSEHKPGCLSHMAGLWGAQLPWEARNDANVVDEQIRQLETQIKVMEVELAEARAAQVTVVPVAELLAAMGGGAPVVVGDRGDVHRNRLRAIPLDAVNEVGPLEPPAPPHPDSAAYRALHGLGNREGRDGAMIGEAIRGGPPAFAGAAPTG